MTYAIFDTTDDTIVRMPEGYFAIYEDKELAEERCAILNSGHVYSTERSRVVYKVKPI